MNIRDLDGLYVGVYAHENKLALISASSKEEAFELARTYFKTNEVEIREFGEFSAKQILDGIYFTEKSIITNSFLGYENQYINIYDTVLSTRAKNVLLHGHIDTLKKLSRTPVSKLKKLCNMNQNTLNEIITVCRDKYHINLLESEVSEHDD